MKGVVVSVAAEGKEKFLQHAKRCQDG